ncbi:MAG: NUDIX hydrolase [Hyphomicrobiaceae bacterium]|nr:NUDIX hydrolase [Hyphomicrobiaceae bacterium]
MARLSQVAALPVKRGVADRAEVLLITSRDTGRWVVPKGWPWPRFPDHEAAAKEAWEEAGVRGRVSPDVLGKYTYDKRRNGKSKPVTVSVYLLEVTEEASEWPEQDERRREWFSPRKASELVDEPELKELLLAFDLASAPLPR